MNKSCLRTTGGLLIAVLIFAGCVPLIAVLVIAGCVPPIQVAVEAPEGRVLYGDNGEQLVNLTLSMGGGNGDARSISAGTSRTSINYYEVAFIHNDFNGALYTKSFYRGETVRLAVPPGIYDNDTVSPGHGSAVLMAGHRDLYGKLRLLAWGIITGVYVPSVWDRDIGTGTGQTISAATSEVEFTLIGLEYVPYDNTGPQAPDGFQIIAPTPAAWQQLPASHNLNNHKLTIDGSNRGISYYPLPDQALGDTLLTLGGNDYYSKDIDGDGKWFDGDMSEKGSTSNGSVWSGQGGATSRPNGDVNDTDTGDVITTKFRIKNMPEVTAFPSLIVPANGYLSPLEVNAIPVDIGSDPGIPVIALHNTTYAGTFSSGTQENTGTVSPTNVTGDIDTATQTFEVTLKTYPLPAGKSGGWALLNAQLYVKAFYFNEQRLKSWVIQTGADLYALDEAIDMESLGGSILCAIGNPSATSISSGGILINGNNP